MAAVNMTAVHVRSTVGRRCWCFSLCTARIWNITIHYSSLHWWRLWWHFRLITIQAGQSNLNRRPCSRELFFFFSMASLYASTPCHRMNHLFSLHNKLSLYWWYSFPIDTANSKFQFGVNCPFMVQVHASITLIYAEKDKRFEIYFKTVFFQN